MRFLKWIWSLWKKQEPKQEPPKKKMPVEFSFVSTPHGIFCQGCGEKLPNFIAHPVVFEVFFQGLLAAFSDHGIGANPYWPTKQCYAIAAWNAGWTHAHECGNKKGVPDGCQESRTGQE